MLGSHVEAFKRDLESNSEKNINKRNKVNTYEINE